MLCVAKENFLDDADSGLDTTFQQLAFHIERFSGVVLLLVTSEDVFRLQLLPQARHGHRKGPGSCECASHTFGTSKEFARLIKQLFFNTRS